MAKRDYYDDPESYWEDKAWNKEQDGKNQLEHWERNNPNHVYGQSEPKPSRE